jgi:protein involved in polysaccharide export with SLBB domain
MNFFKKILLFILIALSLASAEDGTPTKPNNASFFMPTFYEDQVVRVRDMASHSPVNLEHPVDSNYIIGPGDFFEILLPNGTEGMQVSPEGTVAIQGCGLVAVNGLKLFEAKQKILEKLKSRYDQRFTNVHLVQLRRFVVSVQGAVWNPGQVIVSGQARAKSAIYLAGSFKNFANKDSIYIYRQGDTIAAVENILLQVGDIIEVPHQEWHQTIDITLSEKNLTVPYFPKRTLKEYLKEHDINVERTYNSVSIYSNIDNFTRWIDIEQISNYIPEPMNRIVFHTQAPYVYIGGATATVGKINYNSSMHAADYVAASGVTIITGDFSRVSVLRNGKRISVDWATGEILPGDFIEIPRTLYEQIKDITYFVASLVGVAATTLTIYLATR